MDDTTVDWEKSLLVASAFAQGMRTHCRLEGVEINSNLRLRYPSTLVAVDHDGSIIVVRHDPVLVNTMHEFTKFDSVDEAVSHVAAGFTGPAEEDPLEREVCRILAAIPRAKVVCRSKKPNAREVLILLRCGEYLRVTEHYVFLEYFDFTKLKFDVKETFGHGQLNTWSAY